MKHLTKDEFPFVMQHSNLQLFNNCVDILKHMSEDEGLPLTYRVALTVVIDKLKEERND